MASTREQRRQEMHFKVMGLLDEDPSISTREIAYKVGISNGAAYYCVTALVEKGFVKLKNFTQSKTKANYIYELTPRGIRAKAALTVQFLELKKDEYNDLKAEIKRLENELGMDNLKKTEKKSLINNISDDNPDQGTEEVKVPEDPDDY